MELPELRRNWQLFAETDPMWAILTAEAKRGGRWDPEEFFESGRVEVDRVLARTSGLVATGGRALDFGCGVGRVTQALCDRFAECDGVDIAPAMVEQARRYNRFGDRCRYHVVESDDLRMFPTGSFDFVYTVHVLQHMEPRYAHRYVSELLRVLAAGRTGMIQITVGPVPRRARIRWRLAPALRRLRRRSAGATPESAEPVMEMYGVPVRTFRRWVRRAGGRVVADFDWDEISGTASTDWRRRGFVVQR